LGLPKSHSKSIGPSHKAAVDFHPLKSLPSTFEIFTLYFLCERDLTAVSLESGCLRPDATHPGIRGGPASSRKQGWPISC